MEQFQIRRCCRIIDNLKNESSDVKLWRVQRLGIKSKDFKTIRSILEAYLQEGGIDKHIKLKNWPFDQGARVKLEWIGAPFRYEKDCAASLF